jgi:hypothetical protein
MNDNELNVAFIHHDILNDEWYENLDYREINTQSFGLEKWMLIRYETNGNYPNYLTITTIKTLFLLNENELLNKIDDIIESIFDNGIKLDKDTRISGERFLKNGHKSIYSIFDGIDNSKIYIERVKVIVEVWNCGVMGKTIICLGYSQITDNLHNNSDINIIYWEKIVGDLSGTFGKENYIRDDGLIYNIICH